MENQPTQIEGYRHLSWHSFVHKSSIQSGQVYYQRKIFHSEESGQVTRTFWQFRLSGVTEGAAEKEDRVRDGVDSITVAERRDNWDQDWLSSFPLVWPFASEKTTAACSFLRSYTQAWTCERSRPHSNKLLPQRKHMLEGYASKVSLHLHLLGAPWTFLN